jgi:hypothetical protein
MTSWGVDVAGLFSGLLVVVAVANLVVVPVAVWLVNRRTNRLWQDGGPALPRNGWNPWAVISVLFAFCAPGAAAVVTGRVALRELRHSGERGKGLAVTGVTLGYLFLAFVPVVLAYQLFVAPLVTDAAEERIDRLTTQVEQLQDQLKNQTQLGDLTHRTPKP